LTRRPPLCRGEGLAKAKTCTEIQKGCRFRVKVKGQPLIEVKGWVNP